MSTRNDAASPHTAWRQIALVTVLVVLAHALLLAGLPRWGVKDAPLPLEQRFVTRTIVLAPPTPPAPAPSEPVKVAPRKAPEHHAAPAHRSASPHPAPAPEEAPPPPAPVLAAPDASADQARAEGTVPPDATPPATTAAPVSEPGAAGGSASAEGPGSGGDGDAGDIASGLPRAGHSMQVHSSVRLGFEAIGQRGVQPWKGAFGELVWLQDGDQYNARMSIKILFKTISTWTSVGHINASGVAPDRFSETKRSEVASHFVRDAGKVVFSNNAPEVPLLPGAQDRLSVTLQLAALMAGDPERYREGGRISVQTVGPKDAGVWTFVVEAKERISTPAGEFDVQRLSRTPRNDHDYKLELWLAPELGWLPARMRQTRQDGDIIDLLLRDVSAP